MTFAAYARGVPEVITPVHRADELPSESVPPTQGAAPAESLAPVGSTRELATLAWPLILSNLAYTAVGFTDTLYMAMSNARAVGQLIALFTAWQEDQSAPLPRGFAPFKQVFELLRAIRRWVGFPRKSGLG